MFVPFFIQFGFQVWGLLMNFIDRGRVFDYEERIYAFYNQTDIFLLVFGIGILMITIIKIRKYEIRLKNNFAEIGEYSLQWLHNLIFVLFGIWILFLIPTVYEVITGSSPMNIYYPVWIATSALIYWIGYSTYLKQHNSVSLDLEQSETQRNHKLSQNTNTYHRDLLALMEHEKPYLNQDLTLKLLADKLDLSSGYLSQIINQFEGKNFFDFINSYRVASVKEKIQNPDYAHFNLLGIAFDSGFKSKSTFNLSFKKLTGKTPSGFKKSWETSRDKNKTS